MSEDDRRRALRTMDTSSGPSHPPTIKATRAVLTLQTGPDAGKLIPLSATAVSTVGRADTCTLALDDARLSRVHAKIHCTGGVWLLTDEGSTNGTFVNGQRVEKYSALADGA